MKEHPYFYFPNVKNIEGSMFLVNCNDAHINEHTGKLMTNMKPLICSHKPKAIIPSTSSSKSDITFPFSERTTVSASETQESDEVVAIAFPIAPFISNGIRFMPMEVTLSQNFGFVVELKAVHLIERQY